MLTAEQESAMAAEYLVVLPIEPIEPGVEYRTLPLHCTVMPWFRLADADLAALHKELAVLARAASRLELVSREREFFGPTRAVPVHLLESSEPLATLHAGLLAFLEQKNSLPEHRRWIGENYRPHATDVPGYPFTPGSRFIPAHLVLMERGEKGAKCFKESYVLGIS